MNEVLTLFDCGHGVDTLGKCSPPKPDGTRYKEWADTRRKAKLLEAEMRRRGLKSQIIVREDHDVPLKTRCARANAIYAAHGNKNVILVSLHSNAAGAGAKWMDARGWSIWTSPGTTKADALATAIWHAVDASLTKAGYPATFTAAETARHQRPMRADWSDGDPDYEARFTMLTGTKMPAVLIENLFHDNAKDVAFLTSPEGEAALITGIADGIEAYIKSQKP